ncbi:hypothetical protein [Jatrophihabitans fulvus]
MSEPDHLSDEAPEADVAEQARPAVHDDTTSPRTDLPLEADPADAAEQDVAVPLDDDDHDR